MMSDRHSSPRRITARALLPFSLLIFHCVAASASDFYTDHGCEQRLGDTWRWVEKEYRLGEADFDRIAAQEGVAPNLLKAIVLAEQADYNALDYLGDFAGWAGSKSKSIGIGQIQGDRVENHGLWRPRRGQSVTAALLEPATGLRIAAREIKYILGLLRANPTSPYTSTFFRGGGFSDENPYALARLDALNAPGVSPADIAEMMVAKAVAAPYNTWVPAGSRSLIDFWNTDYMGSPLHIYRRNEEFTRRDGRTHPVRNALVQSQNALIMAGCLTLQHIEGIWWHAGGFAIRFHRVNDRYAGILLQPNGQQQDAGYAHGEQVVEVRRTGGRTFEGVRKHRIEHGDEARWSGVNYRIARSPHPDYDLMIDQNGGQLRRPK